MVCNGVVRRRDTAQAQLRGKRSQQIDRNDEERKEIRQDNRFEPGFVQQFCERTVGVTAAVLGKVVVG